MKKILLAAAILMTSVTALLPVQANAQVGFTLSVGNAPPPERYEIIPPPRYGYEWVRGFWDWNGREHVWVPGYWVEVREGYFYDAPRWYSEGGYWRLQRGGWRPGPPRGPNPHWDSHRPPPSRPGPPRDRDHDGIPDRFDHDRYGNGIPDRRPLNGRPGQVNPRGDDDRDGVPNRIDRDRDGDGRPNRADSRPDNPRRN